jgi:glutamate-5-semialdehyde dehydrogenase
MNMKDEILYLAKRAKEASYVVSRLGSEKKNRALLRMAEGILQNASVLKRENENDLKAAKEKRLSKALIDRLTLSDKVINAMASGMKEVSALPDPVGEVVKMWRRPNDLLVGKVRIPLGVITIIYESRPNVTADAACLCLKSGNAVILRGGSEALHSNRSIVEILKKALEEEGITPEAIQMLLTQEREALYYLLELEDYIDLVIPRGGEELIRAVAKNSRIPVIKHYKGVCHIFVDESADLAMAEKIIINAKVQRPGVCNALETLLIHEAIAKEFLPLMVRSLEENHVEVRGCPRVRNLIPRLKEAQEEDWYQEYLDLILSVKVVSSLGEVIEHITQYGSSHTESIITSNYHNAQRFLKEVNSSVVLVNASTRFNDGNQLGLGAEIGISTTKIHAFGPMGLEELTTCKFIVYGEGQIRES